MIDIIENTEFIKRFDKNVCGCQNYNTAKEANGQYHHPLCTLAWGFITPKGNVSKIFGWVSYYDRIPRLSDVEKKYSTPKSLNIFGLKSGYQMVGPFLTYGSVYDEHKEIVRKWSNSEHKYVRVEKC